MNTLTIPLVWSIQSKIGIKYISYNIASVSIIPKAQSYVSIKNIYNLRHFCLTIGLLALLILCYFKSVY